jgi:hypothetical protein
MDRRYIILLVLGILVSMTVQAQRPRQSTVETDEEAVAGEGGRRPEQSVGRTTVQQRNRVQYIKKSMKQEADSLVVIMDIDMSKLNLKTNNGQILTPVIGNETEEVELPKVMIMGAARNKAYLRELELNDEAYEDYEKNPPYATVKPKGTLEYQFSIPFEDWMQDAYLDVEEDLCGCGDESKIARTRVFEGITKDIIAQPVYTPQIHLAFIKPAVETIKKRSEIENAFLDFPRGKTEIQPNFGNNASELAKIDKMIRDISTNKDITVQSVLMAGYASPESSQQFNDELSRARAESMMRYFMKNSNITSSLFETRTGGEDWEGLLKMLEETPLQNKSEILQIISSVSNYDDREKQISKVGGGQPYKIIYEELYPRLRRVKCEVDYTVKDFSIEEAKKNLKTAPQLLSHNEMFIVANSYPVGSADFLQVFEIACEEFPDDPIANLNRAAVALLKKQFREAEKYLNLSDKTSPEYANNTGVYLMLKGDYTEAERTLKQAESSGVEEATSNLRELRKKVANIKNRREAGVDENSDTDTEPANSTLRRRR